MKWYAFERGEWYEYKGDTKCKVRHPSLLKSLYPHPDNTLIYIKNKIDEGFYEWSTITKWNLSTHVKPAT
jgi:hypothetical protein